MYLLHQLILQLGQLLFLVDEFRSDVSAAGLDQTHLHVSISSMTFFLASCNLFHSPFSISRVNSSGTSAEPGSPGMPTAATPGAGTVVAWAAGVPTVGVDGVPCRDVEAMDPLGFFFFVCSCLEPSL